jgi:hypothetical protein
MRPRVAHALTCLHSQRWKARYGNEFEALLVELPASPATIVDVAGSIAASRPAALVLGLGIVVAAFTMVVSATTHEATATVSLAHLTSRVPSACVRVSYIPKTRQCGIG